MAIKHIVMYPDSPLKQRSEPIDDFGSDVLDMAQDLFDTMHADESGVGLAGPQIGIPKRIFVMVNTEDGREVCIVNPEISEIEGSVVDDEGCLSLPGVYAPVARAESLRVRGLDQFGKPVDMSLTGFPARVVQHETDHLDGRVFIDRLDFLTREDKLQEWNHQREDLLNPSKRL